MTTLTCDHCESEIDVEKDPKCVVYDPSGATDVICAECRERAWKQCIVDGGWADHPEYQRVRQGIKRGWRA
jgi:hypothetical protein